MTDRPDNSRDTLNPQPRRFRLSRSRALTRDVLHYHRQVPICPHSREFDLSPVSESRHRANTALSASPIADDSEFPTTHRISWPVLFTKAYALAAVRWPVFRQCLLGAPILHGYEHPHSVGMTVLEREYRGERWLFWGRFPNPEATSLVDLQRRLDWYKTAPVKTAFKRQLELSSLPTPLRRIIWWWNLNGSGRSRAKRAGTFFLTTLAGKGVEIGNPPAFHTGNLTYGPMDESGHCRVTIGYDHRLIDGSVVADFLISLESVLNTDLAAELNGLADAQDKLAA